MFLSKELLQQKKLPLILVFCISLILWFIFYPGYMSADSLSQYGQALSGRYENWHPPIMAIILHYILLMGGGIGLITLIQTLLGCFGVYFLAQEILRLNNATEQTIKWVPFYCLIILLLPISPLPFYLMYFLKDVWILLGLIWVSYLALRNNSIRYKNSKQHIRRYIGLSLIMILIILTRYNAIVLLPVLLLLLFYNLKTFTLKIRQQYFLLLLTVLGYIVIQKQIHHSFIIEEQHPENQVMALESVGTLIEDPRTASYATYINSQLTPNYRQAYYPGNVASVMYWPGSAKTVNQETFSILDDRIRKDYIDLVLNAPFTLLKVKWDAFYSLLEPNIYKYWYHIQLDENGFGLKQNETFKPLRLGWQRIADTIHHIPLTSFIGSEHIVWLLVNILLLVSLFVKKQRDPIVWLILLLPLFYYFSYLLATTGSDFRFMYPATLLVQVIVLAKLLGRKKIEPAPNKSTEEVK